MNDDFYSKIANSSAHRPIRDFYKELIITSSNLMQPLVEIAFNTHDQNHHKACWILELVCEEKIDLFLPYIDDFCDALNKYKSDSAIRSIAKIGLFIVKNKDINLTKNQEEKIIETYLDWLIESNKAANAAYTMRTLFVLGKKHYWVNEELKTLLLRDCSHQTPGYKSAVKDILRKLTTQK